MTRAETTLNPKLIVIALIVLSMSLFLNATSFCYYRVQYVSQQELFENAIRHQAYDMGDLSPGETAHAYIEKHPDCCSVCERTPLDQSGLDFLLGNTLRYVRVAYRVKQTELDQYPKGGDYYEALVEVSPCGSTLHRIGIRVDKRSGGC